MRRLGRNPKEYGTHSLRSGGCTSLRAAGVSWETIKIVGRWRSDSALRYGQLHPSDILDLARRVQSAPDIAEASHMSDALETA